MSTFKVYFKDVVASKPNYDIMYKNERYKSIIQNTLDYVSDYMNNFDLPDAPKITIGNIHGFEDLQNSASESSCKIQALINFQTYSGVKIDFEVPVNIHNGNYVKPSVCIYKNRKYILSQSLIDSIIRNMDTKYPKSTQIYDKDRITTHMDTQKDNLFKGPTQQYDLKEYI